MTFEYDAVEALVEYILESGSNDWVGLWEVAARAVDLKPDASGVDIRTFTLEALRAILTRGYAEVGDLGTARRFVPWGSSAEATLERINSEWQRLGRPPNIGEVCWIQLTEKGRAA